MVKLGDVVTGARQSDGCYVRASVRTRPGPDKTKRKEVIIVALNFELFVQTVAVYAILSVFH